MNNNHLSQKTVIAKHQYARISVSKVRLVVKMIAKLKADEALVKLEMMQKKGAKLLLKVLKSALANAQHNFGLAAEDLQIRNIIVGAGPTLKRWRPRSRGMATHIQKRTAHLQVILEPMVKKEDKKAVEPKEKEQKTVKNPKQARKETQTKEQSKKNGE